MSSQTITTTIYRAVMDDVVEKVQSEFINAGIDESVLQDLKTLWLHKLARSRVLSHENGGLNPADYVLHPEDQEDVALYSQNPLQQFPIAGLIPQQYPQYDSRQAIPRPAQPTPGSMPNIYAGQAPITDPRFFQQTDGASDPLPTVTSNPQIPQTRQRSNIHQVDGEYEDEDEDDGEDEESDSRKVGDDELGSELDDDEEHLDDETPNRILCQYEKVTRTKNKWKSVLKDGVINVNGHDYVFQKAQCDFEF